MSAGFLATGARRKQGCGNETRATLWTMNPRRAALVGAIAALALAGLLLGAYYVGRMSGPTRTVPSVARPTVASSTLSSALIAAQEACRAKHRPLSAASVTDSEIQQAQFDANREAAVAASLDTTWVHLRDGLLDLHSLATTTGADAEQNLTAWQAAFSLVRAECLKTGVGDINEPGPLEGP